jgi:hypothetical protein
MKHFCQQPPLQLQSPVHDNSDFLHRHLFPLVTLQLHFISSLHALEASERVVQCGVSKSFSSFHPHCVMSNSGNRLSIALDQILNLLPQRIAMTFHPTHASTLNVLNYLFVVGRDYHILWRHLIEILNQCWMSSWWERNVTRSFRNSSSPSFSMLLFISLLLCSCAWSTLMYENTLWIFFTVK